MNERDTTGRFPLILIAGVLLTGCTAPVGVGESAPTDEVPVVSQDDSNVVAEAVIEPARWSELRFVPGGKVVEVTVDEGDSVAEGDLLVRFDATDAELTVREAELALALAEAQLALVEAQPRPEEIRVAEAGLEVACAVVSQTLALRDEVAAGTAQVEIAGARAQVAAAQANQAKAEILHDDTMECFEIVLPDDSTQKICPALGRYEEEARAALLTAGSSLTVAETRLRAAHSGAGAKLRETEAAIASALAQQDIARATLDLARAGSRAEDVRVAEATVTQAKARLAAAKAALEDFDIRAPFDGVAAAVNVDLGDVTAPGAVVVVVATLDHLQARTTDLTELDVARVAEGQAVVITVDGLPDAQLRGTVVRIDDQSVNAQGDVTYPVTIELKEGIAGLRWGMSALAEIDVD
ncbi:MAG: HlyD family efflux transporter periplasmic adaptor subunit [Anaerolineae bacterium]|jgi:HlyD family secretion protein